MKQLFKFIIGISLSSTVVFSTGFPKDYYLIKNSKEQKKEFINILKPLIEKGNQKILKERAFIKSFFDKAYTNSFRSLNKKDLKELLRLSKKYKVKNIFNKDKYLTRINTVPTPLALVQGAIESGWGKSRFVRLANNIFGHWTWGEKGLIPLGREEGKTHKIRIFSTLQSSVEGYLLNLNTHYAYKDFRKVRLEKALGGHSITGFEAAETMINYSELREKYVQMLHKMMKEHRLLYYDGTKIKK